MVSNQLTFCTKCHKSKYFRMIFHPLKLHICNTFVKTILICYLRHDLAVNVLVVLDILPGNSKYLQLSIMLF